MAKQKVYLVAPAGKLNQGWHITAAWGRIVGHADSKDEALDAAIRAAKQHPFAVVRVKLRDGSFEEERVLRMEGQTSASGPNITSV